MKTSAATRARVKAYAETHAEQVAGYKKKWRLLNKEQAKQSQLAYKARNPELFKAKFKVIRDRYYAKNRDVINERKRARRAVTAASRPPRPHPIQKPKPRARKTVSVEEARERSRVRSAEYRRLNPEKRKITCRKWGQNNPEKALALVERRRARILAVVSSLTAEEWISIKEQFGQRCAYCLRETKLTMDHVVPVSRGGHHAADNIVPACARCNTSKGNRSLLVWTLRKAAA